MRVMESIVPLAMLNYILFILELQKLFVNIENLNIYYQNLKIFI